MDEVEVKEMTRPQKQGNTEDLQIRQTHLPDLGGGEEQTAIAAVLSDMDSPHWNDAGTRPAPSSRA